MKNRIMAIGVLFIVVALACFLPQYVKVKQLEKELSAARREGGLAQLRDLAGLAYLQASQKDYGLAGGTSSRFFDLVQTTANQEPDSSARKSLEGLLSFRDKITSGLAKGDPGVLDSLQALFLKTRETTARTAK
jgi:hypothetical protein